MDKRLQLQELLETITPQVYYQEPPSTMMVYPCIRFHLTDVDKVYASNQPYRVQDRYQLTLIHEDPDNTERRELDKLPLCTFDRFYTKDNLNHYVYELYF